MGKIASKLFDWLVDLVIRCLWFIGTWWEQRKREESKSQMAEEKKQSKFKVGDRVIGVAGLRGTVTRLGQGEHVVFVKWDDGNSQELTWVSGLKKRR